MTACDRLLRVLLCLAIVLTAFLFQPHLYAQESSAKLIPLRVLLHAHTKASGDYTEVVELALLAKQKGIQAIILTDYLKQKISWGLFHWEKPSLLKYGVTKYLDEIPDANQKVPEVLTVSGAEVTPFYWWSGSIWKGDWTIHDVQKNLLVFGLDSAALVSVPTLETGKSSFAALHGKQQEKPYQQVIDYVAQNGGLSVWSTPDEAFGADFKKGPLRFITPPYTDALLYTQGYTGVALYPEGMLRTGTVGGVWDRLLDDYNRGIRKKPVWAFSEGVIHEERARGKIDRWDNVVLAEAKSEKGILEAMRKGRFYIRHLRLGQIWIEEFSVYEFNNPNRKAFMGEEFETGGPFIVKFSAHLGANEFGKRLSVSLIQSGKVVHQVGHDSGRVDLEWTETNPPENKTYYRITAETSPENVATFISNPIFVKKK